MAWRLILAVGLICAIGTFAGCGSAAGDFNSALKRVQEASADDEDGGDTAGEVEVCHVPPGNPENAHTIYVGAAAVNRHLAHGDYLGPCDDDDGEPTDSVDSDGDGVTDSLDACPDTAAGAEVDENGCEVVYVVAVSAARYHNAVERSNDSARLWGWNRYGQVGDGSSQSAVVSTGLAMKHSLFAHGDGSVWSLGENALGSTTSPVQIGGAADAVQVAALAVGGVYVTSAGEVWGFTAGNNPGCDLATAVPSDNGSPLGPMLVPGAPANVVQVEAGNHHTVALDADGVAWVWGARFGCTPRAVLDGVVDVAAGADELCVFAREDGTAWAMGYNLHGQLGNGTGVSNFTTPTQVLNVSNVVDVAAGDRHSMYVQGDGSLWVAGWNHDCQLGLEEEVNPASPLYGDEVREPVMVALADVVAVAGARTHSVAVLGDDSVWVWGLNNVDQLTLSTATDLPGLVCMPMQVDLGD